MPHGIKIETPRRMPLAEFGPKARHVCETADPKVTFREALSVYRQLRYGNLIFRCTFAQNCTLGVRVR